MDRHKKKAKRLRAFVSQFGLVKNGQARKRTWEQQCLNRYLSAKRWPDSLCAHGSGQSTSSITRF